MKKIILLFFSIVIVWAESCWSFTEKGDSVFGELEGSAIFSFKDAESCKPISDADVIFMNQSLKTDSNGEFKVPNPPDNFDGKLPLNIKKDGYITLKQKVPAMVGSYWQTRFLMTKELPIGTARFVLAWGKEPSDLDLHLVSNNYHISYRNKQSVINKAKLDRDATKGYGAETITLSDLDSSDNYKLYVYQYSSDDKIDHKTNVSIYLNNRIDRVVYMPDGSGRCVYVAVINNNKIEYKLTTVEDSYCH